MTGEQYEVVLVVASVCATIFLCTLANAWARRAASRAAEARERRLLAEAELRRALERNRRPTDDEEQP